MNRSEIEKNAFAMPFTRPSYPKGPYRFINREFMIIKYETDLEALRAIVPEPLEVAEPIVSFEFIRMPDSSGFGDYTESGQVIPVTYNGKRGTYSHAMFLDDEAPIAAGREIWGFPKKLGKPKISIEGESLVGKLDYEGSTIATGTMGYKFATLDPKEVQKSFAAPNWLLKIIPHVDGTVRVCELVEYYLTEVTIKGAWTGPAALQLMQHAQAPVADLPVKKVISGTHIVADLTLPYGKVVLDYLG
ncbi:MAG TPA: acetoacetate decarboxylase [Gammaproteobacteria bacterium]|nr:acetoacetate decarboxylase [Gammaproteobacteria bacterium]